MPTPRPEPGRRRPAPRPVHATCARTRKTRHRCARRPLPPVRPGSTRQRAASAAVRLCRIVHHDRQTHGNDDQCHRRCHDHHHPGKRLAPITSVVRTDQPPPGRTRFVTLTGSRAEGGWTRESGVVGVGGGVVLHPVLALIVILDADKGDQATGRRRRARSPSRTPTGLDRMSSAQVRIMTPSG